MEQGRGEKGRPPPAAPATILRPLAAGWRAGGRGRSRRRAMTATGWQRGRGGQQAGRLTQGHGRQDRGEPLHAHAIQLPQPVLTKRFRLTLPGIVPHSTRPGTSMTPGLLIKAPSAGPDPTG